MALIKPATPLAPSKVANVRLKCNYEQWIFMRSVPCKHSVGGTSLDSPRGCSCVYIVALRPNPLKLIFEVVERAQSIHRHSWLDFLARSMWFVSLDSSAIVVHSHFGIIPPRPMSRSLPPSPQGYQLDYLAIVKSLATVVRPDAPFSSAL